MLAMPYLLCIDVGGPTKIGWADSDGFDGAGFQLHEISVRAGKLLASGQTVALGFEAPIWTPRRSELGKITARRGGVETRFNRAWSAGAGCGALGAGLALMPWVFAKIFEGSGEIAATTDVDRFLAGDARLFVWEAFVSGHSKGLTHCEDARLALDAFMARWPCLTSDVPHEPAINHAAVALDLAGFTIRKQELGMAALVVAAVPKNVVVAEAEVVFSALPS